MRFTFFRPLSSNVDSKIFTPLNDQDRKSPFNVDTISSRHVMRIKKNIHKNYMVDSKYYEGRRKRVKIFLPSTSVSSLI